MQEVSKTGRAHRGIAPDCPLCRSNETAVFAEISDPDRLRIYHRCHRCFLTWLDPACRISAQAARAHYDTHENAVDDAGYRRWLARLADPLLARLEPHSRGLDFGCGAGPALMAMLTEAGHAMTGYDPLYRPDTAALQEAYDVVTLTEVAEHFEEPGREFDRLGQLVRPGGLIGIATLFQTDDERFARWRYRADPTHVSFYRAETLQIAAADRGWSCEIPVAGIALLSTV